MSLSDFRKQLAKMHNPWLNSTH